MDGLSKGTILYVGNFELPDKGASANRVMANRLLFRSCGYRTAFLGVTREVVFSGVRQSAFDEDIYERAYPGSTKVWLERLFSLKDLLEVAGKYSDLKIVMFYNVPVSLVSRAHRYFRNRNVKVLYDCTEWGREMDGSKLKQLYKQYDTHQVQHSLERCVDGLIVISSLMEKSYRKAPKLLLPPLTDVTSAAWQMKRNREDDVFEFCYAGDPGTKDDLSLLLDSFLRLDAENSRMLIIGVEENAFLTVHPEWKAALQEKAGRVSFAGKISHDAVLRKLINTDCFIFIRESNLRNNAGFPTKFAEAYTSGTRVIAAKVSDIADYSADGIRILQSTAQDEIVRAMRASIGAGSSSGLRGAFDYRNYVEPTERFLNDVLGETRGNQQ